ncbi:PA2169 family four-helix-bundle protein [Solirubrum puertoriconensis]|nr:PA2169 family four-helix-bundle protein [Solirubrum puertoriconensis]
MNQPQSSSNQGAQNGTNAQSDNNTQGGGSLLNQAQNWLSQGRDLVGQLPEPVRNVGTNLGSSIGRLSTTQKVVGGALLALGVGYLATRGRTGGQRGTAATLQELLLFVNDRIEGYQRAVDESTDAELRGYYKQLVSQSQRFAGILNDYLREEGGGRETKTTIKGKFYRAFMEAKAAVTGYNENAILGSNIYGEEWAIKAYKEALADRTLTGELRQEVQRQYDQSLKTYERLKQLKQQSSNSGSGQA